MRFACRCEICGNFFMQEEDDVFIQFDFKESTISFICRNPKCKHDNIMDLKNWKKKQTHSSLPKIGFA